MTNTADGLSWTEGEPAITDPRKDGQLEIRALRVGVRKRVEKEHDTPAAAGVGGEHKEGSAKAYRQTAAPTLRPDGTTALDASDDGRIWINDSNEIRVWRGGSLSWELIGNVSGIESFDTDVFSSVKTVAGWTNSTGKLVLLVVCARSNTTTGSLQVEDSGAVFRTLATQQSIPSGGNMLFGSVFVPAGKKARIDPVVAIATGTARYQTFG